MSTDFDATAPYTPKIVENEDGATSSTNTFARAPITTQPQPQQTPTLKYARTYTTQPLGAYQSFVNSCGELFGTLGLIPCCCCANPYHNVQQGQVGLITRFGELARVVDPGSAYVNTFSENLYTASIKTEVQEIPEQACLTKDNVIVYLKSVIYYNIIDPQKAIFGINNIHEALSERTQTTLRDVSGARLLQDIIERREEIADAIQQIISQTAADWGVAVESILIKDLRLNEEITQSLSKAAQAKRIGESKIIAAKAEVESSKLMRQAADILASKPAMQIRYLDAMQNMARSAGTKVIFMPSSGEIDKTAGDAAKASSDDNTHPNLEVDNSFLSRQGMIGNVSMQESLK